MESRKDLLLQELHQELSKSQADSELALGATQLVIGSGSFDADIVLVGEAPGKKEDELGVPFVGASGRFLDEMLVAAGLSRDDVYITNIVKYRPPNNRDPTAEEKQAFWPYLLRQIEIINPKVVITLGRHSGKAFLSDLVISRDHGRMYDAQIGAIILKVIPLYHPAAALYNGSMRQVLIDDFVAATELIKTS